MFGASIGACKISENSMSAKELVPLDSASKTALEELDSASPSQVEDEEDSAVDPLRKLETAELFHEDSTAGVGIPHPSPLIPSVSVDDSDDEKKSEDVKEDEESATVANDLQDRLRRVAQQSGHMITQSEQASPRAAGSLHQQLPDIGKHMKMSAAEYSDILQKFVHGDKLTSDEKVPPREETVSEKPTEPRSLFKHDAQEWPVEPTFFSFVSIF